MIQMALPRDSDVSETPRTFDEFTGKMVECIVCDVGCLGLQLTP